jgi:peptidyl-prolyl cis-trans isomerase SurA
MSKRQTSTFLNHGVFRLMSKVLPGLGLGLVLLSLALPANGQRVLLDRIVALVDEGVVLQSELDFRMIEISQNAARANRELPPAEQFRKELLDTLILEALQVQLAERVSIRFDDDAINRVLGNMAENNKLTFDEYVQALNDAGVYLRTREQVRKQMTMQEVQRGMVNRRIQITEQEIDNFLNSEAGKELLAPDYLVNHLLISSNSEEPAEVRQSKLRYASDLLAKMKQGDDFNQVKVAASQAGQFEVTGTEFGWRKAKLLPTLFRDTVVNMAVGDIEGPVEAGNGYHLIQLANKEGGSKQMVDQTNFRHIMLVPNEIRDEQQTEDAIRDLRQQIIDGADFATLARKNSDDPSSVVAGGDMDWINKNQLPKDMEAIIATLEINELSEPFRSATGWHIAEVLERRVSDLSRIYTRNQAANALRSRKFDLELQNWLIEIREKAFVEYIN